MAKHPVGRKSIFGLGAGRSQLKKRLSSRSLGRGRAATASKGRSTARGKSAAARSKAPGQLKKRLSSRSSGGRTLNKSTIKKLTSAGRGGRPRTASGTRKANPRKGKLTAFQKRFVNRVGKKKLSQRLPRRSTGTR